MLQSGWFFIKNLAPRLNEPSLLSLIYYRMNGKEQNIIQDAAGPS
jgi:hypothetical protein